MYIYVIFYKEQLDVWNVNLVKIYINFKCCKIFKFLVFLDIDFNVFWKLLNVFVDGFVLFLEI